MHQHHTEPTLLRVGDDNFCTISLGKEDEEFADTLRLAVALTSRVALLRAVRLITIVIYLTESELYPSEFLVHPFSRTVREGGELGGNTGHNQIRRTALGLRKKARKTPPASLALRAEQRPVYSPTLQLTTHHRSIIGGTRGTDTTEQLRKTVSTACGKIKAALAQVPAEGRPCGHHANTTTNGPSPTETTSDPNIPSRTPDPRHSPLGFEHVIQKRGAVADDAIACIDQRRAATEHAPGAAHPAPAPTATAPAATAMTIVQADDEAELELNYEENDSTMDVDTAQHGEAEAPCLADTTLDSPQRPIVQRTFREGTPDGSTERPAELQHLTTTTAELLAQTSSASQPALATELARLTAESHQLRNPHRHSIQLEHHPCQPLPAGTGKAATSAKHKKKQPMGRSHSGGTTRNRSRSKPRLFDTHGSDSDWETDDEAA
eukprot:jgi/Tetstr1/435223/TSEL_024142.t1